MAGPTIPRRVSRPSPGGPFDKAIEHASLGEGGHLPDIDYITGEFETDPAEALKGAKSSGSGEPPSGGGGFQNEACEEVVPYEKESPGAAASTEGDPPPPPGEWEPLPLLAGKSRPKARTKSKASAAASQIGIAGLFVASAPKGKRDKTFRISSEAAIAAESETDISTIDGSDVEELPPDSDLDADWKCLDDYPNIMDTEF